jgi:hypothetical protein
MSEERERERERGARDPTSQPPFKKESWGMGRSFLRKVGGGVQGACFADVFLPNLGNWNKTNEIDEFCFLGYVVAICVQQNGSCCMRQRMMGLFCLFEVCEREREKRENDHALVAR